MAAEWIDNENRIAGEAVDFPGAGRLHPIITEYEDRLAADFSSWLTHTEAFLTAFRKVVSGGGLGERGATRSVSEYWYTRIARALTACFTDPRSNPTAGALVSLCINKELLATIFAASKYQSTQHLLAEAAASVEGDRGTLSTDKALLLLAVMPLDDVPQVLMDLAFKLNPHAFCILLVGWLSQQSVFTEQGEANRSRLLSASTAVGGAVLTGLKGEMTLTANAWMMTSYACARHKSDIRVGINQVLVNHMRRMGIQPRPVRFIEKKRPRMLVIHERFVSRHVQYRCYAPFLESLRGYFKTLALADRKHIDEGSDALFDKVIAIDSDQSLVKTVKAIQELKPDIIYFPSIGMADWVIGLANLRLAPIQIASLGVPESTRAPTIDYILGFAVPGHLFSRFSEKVLVAPVPVKHGVVTWAETDASGRSALRLAPGRVQIAINSAATKMTAPFLKVLRQLERQFAGQLKFHFFPYGHAEYRDGVRARLQRLIPDCEVYDGMTYPNYMATLAECDLALLAFPFGATNSVIDVAKLGLPVIVMAGDDLATDSGAKELRRMNHDESYIAQDSSDYLKKAAALIEVLLKGERPDVPSPAIVSRIYHDVEESGSDTDMLNAEFVSRAVRMHPVLLETADRVIDAGRLAELERGVAQRQCV